MEETKLKLRKNKLILIISASSLLVFAILYTLYFNVTKGTEKEIICVVKERFGIYCPGCGGSRSLSAFMRFDFVNSFFYFPAIPVAAVVVISYYIRIILTLIKKDTKYTDFYKFYSFILIPISIILTFAIRNILLIFEIDILGDILNKQPLLLTY